MTNSIELSVIIPITNRNDETLELFYDYKKGIEAIGLRYEIIYVLDDSFPEVLNVLKHLIDNGERITVITLAKWFGETVALNVGFNHSSGDIILTLPAYKQISSDDFPRLIQALDDCDMVLARRWPRRDSWFNRFQASVFNFLIRKISTLQLHDAGCSIKVFKRRIIDEVYIYGDLYTFLPIMAFRHGFKIKELKVSQSSYDVFQRIYPMGNYVRRLLDLLTIFFLIRFTKKPLRFFGLLGLGTCTVGLLATFYVVAERLFFGVTLSDRPVLILSSLLIVLGIQMLAMGLIGEIIIFTHAKEIKEYTIDEIVN
jgi:glycosyltransferase involved in cell wall biosynthesis